MKTPLQGANATYVLLIQSFFSQASQRRRQCFPRFQFPFGISRRTVMIRDDFYNCVVDFVPGVVFVD